MEYEYPHTHTHTRPANYSSIACTYKQPAMT